MRDDRVRLEDILEAIKRVERYAKRGRKAFQTNELIQNWVIHHIQIIGEAAGKLSESFRATHREVPWPQIIKMRHVLVDDYFGINLDEVWAVVERDLPGLKRQVKGVLRERT
jgi:uncharacterized protein with HEPN domain